MYSILTHACIHVHSRMSLQHFIHYCYISIINVVEARRLMMSLFNGNFYKVLLSLTRSPHKDVQYNVAGIIGHLAMNGNVHVQYVCAHLFVMYIAICTCTLYLMYDCIIIQIYMYL